MTKKQRDEALAAAWAEYREASRALSCDRRLGWSDYLAADDRVWKRYLLTERGLLSERIAEAA